MRTTEPHDRLDPALALRAGRTDSWLVLVLWAIRKSWYLLLMLGLTLSAVLQGSPDDAGVLGWIEHHIGTALVAITAALSAGIRIASKTVGTIAAYPLTRWIDGELTPHPRRIVRWARMMSNRLDFARAYTALRWSRPVRAIAAARIGGRPERFFRAYPSIALWANVGLTLTYAMVHTAHAAA